MNINSIILVLSIANCVCQPFEWRNNYQFDVQSDRELHYVPSVDNFSLSEKVPNLCLFQKRPTFCNGCCDKHMLEMSQIKPDKSSFEKEDVLREHHVVRQIPRVLATPLSGWGRDEIAQPEIPLGNGVGLRLFR